MPYQIELGVPEFRDFFQDLSSRAQSGNIDKGEIRLFKKLIKVMSYLQNNPLHNSLISHEITELSERYSKRVGTKIRVWQSYLENNTPAAGRLYWVYGPGKNVITIIGIEPHPESSKKGGYAKVKLSDLQNV